MPVLHDVIGELGHVAREDVETIADVLNLSVAEVHGVVSFYHDFRTEPSAAHRVALCRGEACQSVGAQTLYDDTRARVGAPRRRRRGGRDLLPGQLRARAVRHRGRPAPRPAVGRAARRADGGMALTAHASRVVVPADAAAVSVGADEVAAAFEAAGAQVVRTGSRGMLWLEPLVELDTDAGRIGFPNVTPDDVAAVLAGDAPDIGVVDEHPWLTSQRRVSFARVGVVDPSSISDYEAHGGWAGLRRALSLSPAEVVQEVTDSGLRGRGGAGLPGRHQVEDRAGADSDLKFVACNFDEGDSGTFADRMVVGGRPVHPRRGHDDRRARRRGERGLRLRALRVPPRRRRPAARDRRGVHPRLPRPATSSAPASPSTCTCGSGPAPTSAARSPRCSRASRAAAGEVRAKPPIPALKGLWGRPTAVNNVLTLCAVPMILADGGRGVRRAGHRPLPRHPGLPARRQHQAGRHRRAALRRQPA